MQVTIIHILEAGAYKDRKWGSLPHIMLRENADISMHKWQQILLLFASLYVLVFCYLVIRMIVAKKMAVVLTLQSCSLIVSTQF